MSIRHFLVVAALCAATTGRSQQILCERVLSMTTPMASGPLFFANSLLQPQPDSVRLITSYRLGFNFSNLFQTKLQRLSTATCDTLPVGPSSYRSTERNDFIRVSCSNRRGQVLISQTVESGATSADTSYARLALFDRNGRVRWQHRLPPQPFNYGITSLIEAPGGGYFACGEYWYNYLRHGFLLLRLDSLGHVQWRRTYRGMAGDGPRSLAYSRRGTLLVSVILVAN